MKVVEKECYVPARTYIDKKYVASDGKEFIFESDCIEHEKYLAIKSHPIYTTAIKNVDLFEEGYGATLYYLSSQEDYEYFKETQGFKTEHYFYSNFNKYGAGWYLYWSECGGDYPDNYYLKNYDAYEKRIESDWEEYKSYMRNRMGN
jgi:hypothetical protein